MQHSKIIKELIEFSKNIKWSQQCELQKKEDELLQNTKENYPGVVVTTPISSDEFRYLILGSLPYMIVDNAEDIAYQEEVAREKVAKIWQPSFPLTEYVGTLIRRPVYPTGNLCAKIVVIGDAPGIGLGKSRGALFDTFDRVFANGPSSNILKQALVYNNLYLECFFTNLLKLSTPDNRPSTEEECKMYREYLYTELSMIQPRKILLLGAHVTKMFRDLYPEWIEKTVSLYHPAYILRSHKTAREYAEIIKNKMYR